MFKYFLNTVILYNEYEKPQVKRKKEHFAQKTGLIQLYYDHNNII